MLSLGFAVNIHEIHKNIAFWPRYRDVYYINCITCCNTCTNTATLTGIAKKEPGSWLNALPIGSLGNLLEDKFLRTAIALRLGLPVYTELSCICGRNAQKYGYHALSCAKTARHSRHTALNATIKRGLQSAGIFSTLEPSGLSLIDRKRPDELTLSPWSREKCLLRDTTCVCTLAIFVYTRSLSVYTSFEICMQFIASRPSAKGPSSGWAIMNSEGMV